MSSSDSARHTRVFDALLLVSVVFSILVILFVLAGELPFRCDDRWEVCVLSSNAINGLIQWIGTGLGIGGLTLAWLELRATRTSTEAATAALREAQIRFDHEQRGYLATAALRAADQLKGSLSTQDIGGARAHLDTLRGRVLELRALDADGFDYVEIRSKLDAIMSAMAAPTFAQSTSFTRNAIVSATYVGDALQTFHRNHISTAYGKGST